MRLRRVPPWYPPMGSSRADGTTGGSGQIGEGRIWERGFTRRGLLLGGVTMLVAACVRNGGSGTTGGIWYTVLAGDTLSSLSRRSGISIEAIIDANDLTSRELPPGRRLWLPGVKALAPDTSAKPPERPVQAPPEKPKAPEAAPDGHYELVPRSAWTREPVGPNHILMDKVLRITIHHTDEHAGMDGLPDLEVVRRIENYHRGPQKRWAAIGYHFLVGKDGKIYEGRPVKYQGAHTSSNNENNLGISVIGDCHHHMPNPKQLAALKAFIEDQRERFAVPRSQIFGHRDLRPTICPGDLLYGWVKAYRDGRSK